MSITRRKLLASSLLAAAFNPLGQTLAAGADVAHSSAPWRNWSGYLQSNPAQRFAPKSEQELADFMKGNAGGVRPVGAGHSFSPLVPTNDALVVLDNLSGVVAYDDASTTAVLRAGTRLSDSGPMLDQIGQAMINLPDIDRQTIGGAIATSTHGTGLGLGSLSAYVTSVRLVTPEGRVIDANRNDNPEIYQAARTNLGALGVLTEVGFQNRKPFKLKSMAWVEKTNTVIESFAERCLEYEHYEFMPFLHADFSLVIAHKETDGALKPPVPEEDQGDIFGVLSNLPVFARRPVINFLVEAIEPSEAIEASYLALTNIRNDRFNEMEYSVAVEDGLACVREILDTVTKLGIDALIPLEYRVIEKDDSWLSMFSGSAKASISIHRMAGYDYKPYFDVIEPIFWKYGGRPHWGKVHSLGYHELSNLYPHLDDFIEVQTELDPSGKMLNQHIAKILNRNV